MKLGELSYKEVDEQIMGKLVFDDAELSPTLKGHLIIEKILETLISNNLADPKALFQHRLSFDLKLAVAKAMGLLPEKHFAAFKALDRVRNKYAHQGDYQLTLDELTAFKFDWEPVQEQDFVASCTKGVGEAAKIVTIFLCWKAMLLIKKLKNI